MPNPLFGGLQPPYPAPRPANPMMASLENMLSEFNNFRSSFQGDPRQQVQQLLSSGKMSNEQFNKFSEMAKQIQTLFHV